MGEILAVRISSCDDSTYWQTGKLLFSGQCIANGNCIALGNASACGGINGYFAFNGNIGLYLSSTVSNAAAADGRSTGEGIILVIQNTAACSSNVRRSSFGALDGNFVSGILGVGFCFCAATDTGSTSAALCIFDGDIALDGHVTSAKSTAADTGTFFAAGGVSDLSVASNGYIADANSAAANAGTTIATFCIFDFGVAFNGHISDSFINCRLLGIIVIIQKALAAADACTACLTFGVFNDCIPSDEDIAVTIGATADAGSSFTALCVFDDGITFNGHCAQTLIAAADASSHIATRGFGDGAAADGDSAISSNKSVLRYRAKTATNTGTIIARSLCGDIAVGNCDSTIAVGTAANTGTQTAARSGDRTTGNCHIAVTADGVRVTGTAANTGTLITTVGSDLTTRNGHLAVLFVTAADASTVVTTRGSQTASSIGRTALCGAIIILFVLNRQRAAVVGLVVFQTGVAISACQRVVAVQLDVRIAAAGHFHGGFVLIGVVAVFVLFINIDVHIIQSDIGRLVFVCVDGDRVPRACAGDGDFVVQTIFDVSAAVADVFLLVLIIPVPLADEIAAFRSVDINGASDNIIRSGKSRKGHAGHHGTGESESCDPLCGNAGRGRCLFLAERHRNMPQDAHGESAIRDH